LLMGLLLVVVGVSRGEGDELRKPGAGACDQALR